MEVVSDQDKIVRSLKLQLLIERIAIASLALILSVVFINGRVTGGKSLIMVNGKPVACVPSEQVADDVLRQIKQQTGDNPDEIKFAQDVRIASAPRDMSVVSRHMAVSLVGRMVSPIVPRWAIIVNGKPVVAVSSKQMASEVLDQAKYRFGKLATNLSEEPQFKETVKVGLVAVNQSICRGTVQEATECLFATTTTAPVGSIYTVSKGDLAGAIAANHHIKLAELEEMNPGRNLARLQIGDQIHVKGSLQTKPKLTVVVRDETEHTESVPPPVEQVASKQLRSGVTREIAPGRPGERRIKAAVIYENGHKVGYEVMDETILRQPLPRRVAVGVKQGR